MAERARAKTTRARMRDSQSIAPPGARPPGGGGSAGEASPPGTRRPHRSAARPGGNCHQPTRRPGTGGRRWCGPPGTPGPPGAGGGSRAGPRADWGIRRGALGEAQYLRHRRSSWSYCRCPCTLAEQELTCPRSPCLIGSFTLPRTCWPSTRKSASSRRTEQTTSHPSRLLAYL